MMINMGDMLKTAKAKGYGIVAPCPMSPEQIKWCFESARKLKAPVIICNHAFLPTSMPIEVAGDAVNFYSKHYPEVPASLCLDHGENLEAAVRAIKAGYTGVMIDRSMCPDDENIEVLKEVVKMAHAMDVGVEGAVGGVPWRDATPEEVEAYLTKVDIFKRFVKETEVDAVAVAVGSFHGDNKTGTSNMHYNLIAELKEASPAALVMHGCSGSGSEGITNSARYGITKFNVGGELVDGAIKGIQSFLEEEEGKDDSTARAFLSSMSQGYCKNLEHFITMVGSVNKA